MQLKTKYYSGDKYMFFELLMAGFILGKWAGLIKMGWGTLGLIALAAVIVYGSIILLLGKDR